MDFLKLVLGVEISWDNFRPIGILYSAIVIGVTYAVFFHLDYMPLIACALRFPYRYSSTNTIYLLL